MNITIVQTFTDGFTTYQSGQELSVPSEVAQRWIADGTAQADTDGQQSWLSSTEVAATRALVSGARIRPTMTTAEMNAVMLALNVAGGGVCRVEPGIYTLTQSNATNCLEVPALVSLIGPGMGEAIFKPADTVPPDTHTIGLLTGFSGELAHFSVDGNRARLPGSGTTPYRGEDDSIGGPNSSGAWIHHLEIYNAADCAVDLDNATAPVVEDCVIYNCNGNAVHLAGASGCTDPVVRRNKITNCGHERNTAGLANAAGVDCIGLRSQVYDNTITNCYRGVVTGVVSGTSNALVTNNVITGPAGTMNQGISGDVATRAIANTVTGATSSGISACNFVSQNTIDGGAQNINCTAAGCRVLDNILTGATSQCVMVNSASITLGRIAGNSMTRNGTKVNFNAGSGVVVEFNDFIGTGTAVSGTTVGSNTVRTNP